MLHLARALLIVLATAGAALADAPLCSPTLQTQPGAGTSSTMGYSIPVGTMPVGSVAANSLLPAFVSNPADAVVLSPYWTTTPSKYLVSTVAGGIILQSLYCSRDQEVTSWVQSGIAYLRYANGNAIFFNHNRNVNTLTIGIVRGLVLGQFGSGTKYTFYTNTNLSGTIPGYSTTGDTTGQTWTFGVNAYGLYAKFNGTTVVNLTMGPWALMQQGAVALTSIDNSSTGWRDISISHLPTTQLWGDPAEGIFDARDWGVRTTPHSALFTASVTGATMAVTKASEGLIYPGMIIKSVAGSIGNAALLTEGTRVVAQVDGTPGGVGNYTVSPAQTVLANPVEGWYGVAAGTIPAGSNQLVLDRPTYLKVGDWVIVQCGTERGACVRGSAGVGGQWPALAYATETLLQADLGQPASTYAWAADTGNVWHFVSGVWVQGTSFHYYADKAIPQSLQAQVQAVSTDGLTLTLSQQAISGAVNAAVYLDNAPLINFLAYWYASIFPAYDLSSLVPRGATLQLPRGMISVGGEVILLQQNGWTIRGHGRGATTLFSPNAIHGVSLFVANSPNTKVEDLALLSNGGQLNYFGTAVNMSYNNQPTSVIPHGYNADGTQAWSFTSMTPPLTQTVIPQSLGLAYGIEMSGRSDNSIAQRVMVTDVWEAAAGALTCNNCWVEDAIINLNADLQTYTQWQVIFTQSQGGGCSHCVFNMHSVTAALSMFESSGVTFKDIVLNNGLMESNTSNNFTISDVYTNITNPDLTPAINPIGVPLLNVNNNAGGGIGGSNGMIKNMNMLQTTLLNSVKFGFTNSSLTGIIISGHSDNVRVIGGSYFAPDWVTPGILGGPRAVVSQGGNTFIDGFAAGGAMQPGTAARQINVFTPGSGIVANSFSPSIGCVLPACTLH